MKKILPKLSPALAGISITAPRAMAFPGLPIAAAIPPELKSSFQVALGVLFLIGFFWGVINIWGGAEKMKRGDADGKMGIVSGIIISAAALIMSSLYYIFGIGDGALTPQF